MIRLVGLCVIGAGLAATGFGAKLTVSTLTLPPGTVGTAYNQTLAATGGTGGYTWSTTAGTLPANVTLAANGTISGTPTTFGTANFTVQVKDSSNATATQALSIAIAPLPLTVTTTSLPGGTVGTAYNQTLAASGGTGGYTWLTTAGALPANLTLAASGGITGTPTATGTANFTVQVKDSSGVTATQALSITVVPPPLTVTTTSLPGGTMGTAYNQTLAASGGTGGYTWSTTAGALPANLTLAASGGISGTPTATGTANFTVQVKDSSGTTATQALSITIAPPPLTVTTTSLPIGTMGTAYNQTLAASGGTGGYTWSTTAGTLPANLTLAANGGVSGTPTATGTANFTVQVKDSSGATATQALSITVVPPPLTITTTSLPGGTQGTAYNQTLAASGGTGGYTWSTTAGTLPANLTLAASGSITGTPTATGTANFTVQVKDSSGATATQALSISIVPPPLTVTTSSLPGGTVTVAYNQTLAASGGTGGYTWSTTAGALPTSLTLSTGGVISGTPSAAGTANFTVQVKDSSNVTATRALSITIAPPPLTVTTPSLPDGTISVAYSQTLAASGGTGGYTWSLAGGALPANLTLGTNGSIGGTPTATGTANFTVQVKDSSNVTATQALSITINPPQLMVTTSSLPAGTINTLYSQGLSATGGTGGYTWSVTVGAPPAGLSLGANGIISGTPSAVGTANFTVQVKDSSNATATQALSLTIAPPQLTVTTSSLPGGTVGVAYSQTLSATGGTGGDTWSVTGGALPANLSLSASGTISGSPTTAGTANFTVQVKDSSNATATQALSITIAVPPLTVTTSSLPAGTAGIAYSQTLSATGGTGSYAWSLTAGSLPQGLSLAPSGSISGNPTTAGTANFTVQVKDSSNTTATQTLSLTIAPPQLTVATSSLPGGTVGTAYSQTLSATGGTGGYTWSTTSGALPANLTLSAGGTISGTPTAAGTANFTVQVKDSSNTTATQALSITVVLPQLTVTTSSLPGGTVGTAYSQTLAASGGTGGNTWSTTGGALPANLTISASGTISGTPTTAGTANFTVQVKDSSNNTATQALSITIALPQLTVTTSSLPGGTVGTAYSQTLSASGGAGGNTWSTTGGSLPAGLSLAANGNISGTPNTAGTANFTVQVKDSSNATATQALSITIAAAQLTVTTSSLPAGTIGIGYSQTLSASGGAGGYTWSLTGGSLPGGLSLAASGNISGTPNAAGTASFTVQVKDSAGATATRSLSITTGGQQLTITTSALPVAMVGSLYSQALQASGGSGSYSWSVTGGSLPQGLTLSPGGLVSGTPGQAGSSNFAATVTDGNSSVTRTLTLVVNPGLTITTSSLSDGKVGTAYSDSVNVAGGVPPYTWSVASGQLPPGISVNAQTGVISGTPTVNGAFVFSIRVVDSFIGNAAASFTINIHGTLAITTAATLATASAGTQFSQSFAASGGAPPYSWSLSGTLPAGLAFSTAGVLSGTPTQVGTFPVTVQVTDSSSAKATAGYSVVVTSGLAIATPPVLPNATSGVSYSFTLQPVGGTPPYSWVVTAGSIPAGFNFSGGGQISGTATSTGDFNFTVQVTDGNSNTAQKQLTITVKGPLSITSTTLPAGVTGTSYSQTLTAAGGTPPYSWSVSAGSLPNGLTLELPTGVLAGTPTATGSFNFTVTVTDSNSATAQAQFTVAIGAGLTFTTAASLPGATAGVSYSVQLQVTGGQQPYSWSLAQGSLPGGLSLNGASGAISGVPTASGTFNFTIGVSDSAKLVATHGYTIVVGLPALPAISISGLSGNLQPLQQPLVGISLASPYPTPITGTVSLSFAAAGPNPVDDPSVQFSTGGRSATFTIPANATQATFSAAQFALQAGSVMGSITVSIVSLQAGGSSLNIPPASAQTASVAAAAPVISTVSLVHTQNGIQLQIIALTDTRELTQASVTFQAAAGTSLQNSQLVVPLSDVATGWFQGTASASFGGQFALTLPFTFQGSVSLSSVSLVLSNSSGDSPAASANY